ncbi:glycosyltransferase family 4 protein [bacterium]|nr:glycosyltransferase family 4 protein [bacterium]
MGLRIDIGVGGRFHADRLAGALLQSGHSVEIHTTYPISRFPKDLQAHVHSQIAPEVFFRLLSKLGAENSGDLVKMHWFGSALAKRLQKQPADLFIGWSSFSLETLRLGCHRHRAILRDSAHMRTQLDILNKEARFHGVRLPDRSAALEREEEEYALADTIFVLSEFARQTFLKQGISERKLAILPLGADTSVFKPIPRAPTKLPLKLVYFGSVSLRKGVSYLIEAVKAFKTDDVQLTIIGPVDPVLASWEKKYPQVQWKPPMDHAALARFLPTQDVFVLPTLEDGFGQTLPQAMACGLVPITTDHCGAAEILRPGETGFVVPAASTQALCEVIANAVIAPEQIWKMRECLLAECRNLGWERYSEVLALWVQSLGEQRAYLNQK